MCLSMCTPSLLDLPWEDVIYRHILIHLEWKALFRLRQVSKECKNLVEDYFSVIRVLDFSTDNAIIASKINAEIFSLFADKCHSVRTLLLPDSGDWLTDVILVPFLESNPHLKHLDLTECSSVGNGSMHAVSLYSHKLKKLVLKDCHWLNGAALSGIAMSCMEMEYVDLTGCWTVNDEALVALLIHCKKIKCLSIGNIYGITDNSARYLSMCGQLTHLNIRGCWRIGNETIRLIAKYCGKLESVQLRECTGINEASIQRLRARNMKIDVPAIFVRRR
ncbi:F-box/LRR-repeat protein 15-like isoform X2 [Lineus longissimus]|uniref:F-box/LRR-repeat protein 15-like isoform X2 n=1 Tax=Lineus longissimus TaxID=88925 RepID=UPI002B4F0591